MEEVCDVCQKKATHIIREMGLIVNLLCDECFSDVVEEEHIPENCCEIISHSP